MIRRLLCVLAAVAAIALVVAIDGIGRAAITNPDGPAAWTRLAIAAAVLGAAVAIATERNRP